MTPAAARALLLALPRFADAGANAYKPGLDRMRTLLAALGDPHRTVPSVHVAGTNGKGSTASMVAAVATAAGLRTGLHTSPHLLDLSERMRLDGAPAPDDWLADAVGRCADLFAAHAPSFFEATAALSFLFFAEHGADLAVLEVGLGGRLDATNVITPRVAAVTHVGLDHTDLLGGTLPEIAREKAGIAKRGAPLLHALPAGAARDALEAEAAARGATVEAVRDTCRVEPGGDGLRITTPARTLDGLALGLPGAHQAWNAALAVRAAEHALPGVTAAALRAGLADVVRLTGLRGRGETVAPGIVADVAHNADGWRAALDATRPAPGGRLYVAVGVMADKDADALALLLADAGATAVPVALPGDRARSRADLTARLAAHGVPVLDAPDLPAALRAFDARRAPDDRLLVTGSHLTVAALLEALAAADCAK